MDNVVINEQDCYVFMFIYKIFKSVFCILKWHLIVRIRQKYVSWAKTISKFVKLVLNFYIYTNIV